MRCRICGNMKNNQNYEVREMMFGYRDVFIYFQCSKCNCLQIKEFPPEMSKYYPDRYYSYGLITRPHGIKKVLADLRNKYALLGRGIIGKVLYAKYPDTPLNFLSSLPLRKATFILDVGCGAGSLLYLIRDLGFTNILGVDPFIPIDIEYDNGLRIEKKTLYKVQGKWDVVIFNHSFEHVHDPEEILQIVYDLLNPDGYCVISIPTVSSYAWKHYGVKWVQLDAPRHFFLHSTDSVSVIADKTGFMVEQITYDSTSFQFLGSEQYARGIPLYDACSYKENPSKSIFTTAQIAYYKKRAKELNASKQGDQIAIYLRKA